MGYRFRRSTRTKPEMNSPRPALTCEPPRISTLKEKLSPADHSRGAPQKHSLAFGAHHLCPARCVHSHRRLGLPRRDGGHRYRAGSRARRPRLPHPALEKSRLQIVHSFRNCDLNVHALLELGPALKLRRFELPVLSKLGHEDHQVRVPQRHRYPSHFPRTELNRDLLLHTGLAHFHLKLVLLIAAGGQRAGFHPRSGADRNLLSSLFFANVSRHTTRAVARHLRLRAIPIQQPDLDVGRGVREHPFHTIGSDTLMPVADTSGNPSHIGRSQRSLNE